MYVSARAVKNMTTEMKVDIVSENTFGEIKFKSDKFLRISAWVDGKCISTNLLYPCYLFYC